MRYAFKGILSTVLVVNLLQLASAQTIVGNPTATQIITQPQNTTLNINRINSVRVVSASDPNLNAIQKAINDAPAGGTVIVPPNYTETLSSNLSINKSIVLQFEGAATINQGTYQVIVPAGTDYVSIMTNYPVNGNTVTDPVVFSYTGSGPAFQIGGSGAAILNLYMKGLRISADNLAANTPVMAIDYTEEFWLDGINVSSSSTSRGVIGILIDGLNTGPGVFSGIGRIDFPIINIGSIGNGGSAGSAGIRVQNVTTHTLVTGGHIQMWPIAAPDHKPPSTTSDTVCFDVNGGSVIASELTFYAPNCEAASVAIAVEGNGHAVGDMRTDSNVNTLTKFDSNSASNKIRFVDVGSSTAVIDQGSNNSVEFPSMDQVHSDIWRVFASGQQGQQSTQFWGVTHLPTNTSRFYANWPNTFINGGGGGIWMNVNSGFGVNFGDGLGDGIAVASIDNNGNATFSGNVTVSGTLNVSGAKNFKIDDPIDPANKYLIHSSIESPEMKDLYDGVVQLDEKGEAEVKLPAWFQALNRDFRYQLTCVGGSAPVYIAEEINNNRFRIAGGRLGLKVSWQVTGIRHDPAAQAHGYAVEEEKPAGERGHYLFPGSAPSKMPARESFGGTAHRN
jgi:hypothetical protein